MSTSACDSIADLIRAAVSAESVAATRAWPTATEYARAAVSGRSPGLGAIACAARWACCGTTTNATRAVTKVPTLTAPMKIGRCMAFRARAARYVARGTISRYSVVSDMAADLFAGSVHLLGTDAPQTREAGARRSRSFNADDAPTEP